LFGESHLRAYTGVPRADVAAVASRSGARAKEIAEKYGIRKWYGSYDELIADPEIDAISLTTGEADHLAPTLAALKAGKHILVEKPIASSLEDATAMIEAARVSTAIMVPGHVVRFDPKYAELQRAAVSGQLGEVVSITARRNRTRRHIDTHGRVHLALVTAIHDLDIINWVAQSRVKTIRAHHRIGKRAGDAHGIWMLMKHENGIVTQYETNWMVPEGTALGDDAFSVVGTAGIGRVQTDVPGLQIYKERDTSAPNIYYEGFLHGAGFGALRDELASFVDFALAGKPSTVVTPEDGMAAMVVALAAIESAERDREIEVTWPEVLG
jgi:predicted dehydrogenase